MGLIGNLILGAAKSLQTFRSQLSAVLKTDNTTVRLTDPNIVAMMGLTEKQDLSSPYTQIAKVYGCINSKARNIAGVPYKISRKGGDEPIESGGIVDLFRSPNPMMNWENLIEAIIIGLDSEGEHFLFPDPTTDREGIPVYLWSFSSAMVKVRSSQSGAFLGWTVQYGKSKMDISPEELIQFKYFNPNDAIRGLKPLKALDLSLKISWYAQQYNKKFFENDATPGIVYENEKSMTREQVLKFKHEVIDSRTGVQKSHIGLLLHGGIKAKTLALSNKDIQLLETLKLTDDDIFGVFGVPKSEMSIRNELNYATALSEDLGYWKKTLIPLSRRINEVLNTRLLYPLGYEGSFDYKKIDALNNELINKVDAAQKLFSMGFTPRELNHRFDLGFEDQPWHDISINDRQAMQISEQPQPQPGTPRDVTPPKKLLPKQAPEEIAKAMRAVTWKRLIDEVQPVITRAASAVRKYILTVRKKISKKIGRQTELKDKHHITLNEVIDALSDDLLKKYLKQYVEDAVKRGVASMDIAFDLVDERAQYFITTRLNKIGGINDTLKRQFEDVFKRALEEGATEDQTAQMIIDGLSDVLEKASVRAKTIARTEVHGAYSDGRYEAMESTDPAGKMWITARDKDVRDEHETLDGEKRLWNDYFSNGLSRPLEPGGPAEQVINCRCIMVPIYDLKEID